MIKRTLTFLAGVLVATSALAQLVEKPDLQGQAVSKALVTATGATTGRPLADRFSDFVNAKDFGVSPTNWDNTSAIAVAVTALSASGTKGGCINFGIGTFRVAGSITLPSGVSLCGNAWSTGTSGAVATMIQGTGTSGQVLISVGNGSDNPNNNVVRDIVIEFANAQSSGAAIKVRNGHAITLQHIRIGVNAYDGIVLEGGTEQYNYFLSDIEIGSGRRGIWIGPRVSGVPKLVQNVTMRNISVAGVSGEAFYLQNVGGVQGCIGCEALNVDLGLVIAPGNGEKVDGVLWQGSFLDANTNGGLVIAPTGSACTMWTTNTPPLCGLVSQLSFVNVRPAYSQAGPGVLIDSTGGGMVKGISFTNLESGLNYKDGVRVIGSNTSHIYLTNPKVSFNNVANAGGDQRPGIYFGAGVTKFSVIGGCSSDCSQQFPGTVNRQTYGVQIAATADYYSVQGVNVTGNATDGISYDVNAVHKAILGNIGASDHIIQAPLRIVDTTSGDAALYINGVGNLNGGAAIQLQGDGVTTPNKTVRAHNGAYQIANNAYNAVIYQISDGGVPTIPASCSGQPTGKVWNDSGTLKVCP